MKQTQLKHRKLIFSSNLIYRLPPDSSFILYSLINCYLKQKYNILWVFSNESPTHYLSAMRKMGINYSLYAKNGYFNYLDLFSRPFDDYDYGSLPLSDTSPPTYNPTLTFKDLKTHTFQTDLPARENLCLLAKSILKQAQSFQSSITKGLIIIFDTINPIFDILEASQLEVNEFLQCISDICQYFRKAKIVTKSIETVQKKTQDDYDDYYDDDDDDLAAMAARRGGKIAVNDDKEEEKQDLAQSQCITANFVFMYNQDLSDYDINVKRDITISAESNYSGYSLDVDGQLIIKLHTYNEKIGNWIEKVKSTTKFKLRENKVDYFEYFTF